MLWVKSIGGLKRTIEISENNLSIVEKNFKFIVARFYQIEKKLDHTSICLKIKPSVLKLINEKKIKKNISNLLDYLDKQNITDIGAYRDIPLGIRIWGELR